MRDDEESEDGVGDADDNDDVKGRISRRGWVYDGRKSGCGDILPSFR